MTTKLAVSFQLTFDEEVTDVTLDLRDLLAGKPAGVELVSGSVDATVTFTLQGWKLGIAFSPAVPSGTYSFSVLFEYPDALS